LTLVELLVVITIISIPPRFASALKSAQLAASRLHEQTETMGICLTAYSATTEIGTPWG
jgi:Tfp pilus assembly protein FimT